ncbi:MAG: right-handed parallel beta-helix repeat-containing protein [Myxococcota bacterium]
MPSIDAFFATAFARPSSAERLFPVNPPGVGKARPVAPLGLLLLALAHPTPVQADPGRIEINQAAALAGGVTPADAPGFPVTLDRAGSYVLTGDLDLSAVLSSGIEIVADDVSLDLAGFGIRGPVTCVRNASDVTCSQGALPFAGIHSSASGTRIRNGRIRGIRGSGVLVGASATLEDLDVVENAADGIATGAFASVLRVRAERCGDDGFDLGSSSRIVESQAFANGSEGIEAGTNVYVRGVQLAANAALGLRGTDVIVLDSTISGNQASGVGIQDAAVLRNNLLLANGQYGVAIDGGGSSRRAAAIVMENVVRESPLGGIQLAGEGILSRNVVSKIPAIGIACYRNASDPESGCLIAGNVVNENDQGILAASGSGHVENVLYGNTISINASPTPMGTNLCDGSTTCP